MVERVSFDFTKSSEQLKSVYNNEVVVTEINTNADGEQLAVLKRKDGRKFFTSFPTIKANVTKAIDSEELIF